MKTDIVLYFNMSRLAPVLLMTFLLSLTRLFIELCWHVNVLWHLSLQSLLPCAAAPWCYLLEEKCGNQHSNQFLPVVTYRKGLLTACCCWCCLRTCFSLSLLCWGKGKTIMYVTLPDSIWFTLLLVYSCFNLCFIWSFLPWVHWSQSLSVSHFLNSCCFLIYCIYPN